MGCFMSCISSACKNHHYSTTDDSTATLSRAYQRCHPSRCRPNKPVVPSTTLRKGARRRRLNDDIPKLPKTFFVMGQLSSEREDGSRPFTPTTADPFSESMVFDPSESPIHWGIWRRQEVYTIPLASEMGSFTSRSPMAATTPPPLKMDCPVEIREVEKVGKPPALGRERLEAFAEKRRAAAAVAAEAARQRSEFGLGCGMFRKDLEGELSSPAWTPVMGSFAVRSPARGGNGRGSRRWSGRAIGNGVRIQFVENDDVCVKRWEQGGVGDQSVDGSYLSMECFVF